jgi:hypothetical protein
VVRSPWFFWTLSGSPFFSFQVSLNAIRCLKIFEAIIYLCRRNSSFFYELGWRPWTSTSNNQVQTTLLSSSQIRSQITGMLRGCRDCEDRKCILLEVSKSVKDHPEIILTATRCSSFSSSSLQICTNVRHVIVDFEALFKVRFWIHSIIVCSHRLMQNQEPSDLAWVAQVPEIL